jgi:hypothetical protein
MAAKKGQYLCLLMLQYGALDHQHRVISLSTVSQLQEVYTTANITLLSPEVLQRLLPFLAGKCRQDNMRA